MRATKQDPWPAVRDRLRGRGQRWTPQRRAIIEVLARTKGHVTGADLVDRCRALEPATVPSTVYRTLDLLEELGLVRHGHDAEGREEYHVLPDTEHGHLHCSGCGETWEIADEEASGVSAAFASRRFDVDLSHVTVVGRCARCRTGDAATLEGYAKATDG